MDRKSIIRRRSILYLIEFYLSDYGYKKTAESLKIEAKLSNEKIICDNINLESIIIEYEIFYFHKFQKYPQLCKTTNVVEKLSCKNNVSASKSGSEMGCGDFDTENKPNDPIFGDSIVRGKCIGPEALSDSMSSKNESFNNNYFSAVIQNMSNKTVNIHWEDIKGLDFEKEVLKEAIIYPIKYSNLFQGAIQSWKTILLYGPPGTGKTLLATAVANESSATFFSISASSVISKWRGDTEKLIKATFDVANQDAPSIIFIDEFDSFALIRNSGDHEASRRMKSELFIRMDELLQENNSIFLLAATNTPWDLDESMLRRFEKHLYIGPPDEKTRKLLLESYLPKVICNTPRIETLVDLQYVAQMTENYSGCDLKNMCKEIKMNSIRKIIREQEINGSNNPSAVGKNISIHDVEMELSNFRPSLSQFKNKYTEWKAIKSSQRFYEKRYVE